jgi:transcriptional regulator with XRE-family HTH domain
MDIETLKALMDARGMRQVDLVAALGIEQDKVSKVFNGKRKWQPDELLKILAYFGDHDDSSKHPDTPQSGYEDYVDVPILPSFVGMGVVGLVMAI